MRRTHAWNCTLLVAVVTLVLTATADPVGAQRSTTFTEHFHDHDFGDATFAYGCDIDQDGWTDILFPDWINDEIIWLRNDGAAGFDEIISVEHSEGLGIYPSAIDLDLDGDIDLISGLFDSACVAWWENDGAESFTRHTIGSIETAHMGLGHDIDEDGDLDVVGCGTTGGNRWWENDGSMNFTEHMLMDGNTSHYSAAADLDGDDDEDIITTDFDHGVRWWENDGSENFTMHLLPLPQNHWVYAIDLDQDTDVDILAAAYNPSVITWWDNDGAGSFTRRDIPNTMTGALMAEPGDFDRDGDLDVCAVSHVSGDVNWYENDGSMGFAEYQLSGGTLTLGAVSQAVDVDNDGDEDILAAGRGAPNLRWYENTAIDLDFSISQDTGIAPFEVMLTEVLNVTPGALRWDFGADGSFDASGASPEWSVASPGVYDCMLEVDFEGMTGRKLKRGCVEAFDSSSSLLFDGGGECVHTPPAAGLELAGAFTLEAWIRPSGWGTFPFGTFGYGHILSKGPIDLYLVGEHFARDNHSAFLDITHADATASGSGSSLDSIVLDAWQHVAVVYDGISEVTMFVDGDEVDVSYTTAPSGAVAANAGDSLGLGNVLPDLNKGFEGCIDEVRVWSIARTGEEVAADMFVRLDGDEPGLAGYWRLDDAHGTSVIDAAGTCGDGTIVDAEWVQGALLYPTGVVEPPGADGLSVSSPQLFPNHPNPFNPVTRVAFELTQATDVTVMVYDAGGRAVRTLASDRREPGIHHVSWDGRDDAGRRLASGIYLCRLSSAAGEDTEKMVLLK